MVVGEVRRGGGLGGKKTGMSKAATPRASRAPVADHARDAAHLTSGQQDLVPADAADASWRQSITSTAP